MAEITAAVCRAFNQPLSLEQVQIADPGPGQVRVALKAVAICHSDIAYIDGAWGGALPAVYGHEAAGIIESVGSPASTFAAGDRVAVTLIRSCGTCRHCADGVEVACETELSNKSAVLHDSAGVAVDAAMDTGAFASMAIVDESQIVKLPDQMDFDVAALLTCGVITGFGAVRNTAAVTAGKSVAVIGCGGVGLNAIQGAAHQGAAPVVAIDMVDSKLTAAKSFGASNGLQPTDPDFKIKINSLTDGRRFDFVFVTVGAGAAIDQAFQIVGSAGAVVLVGMPPNEVYTQINPTILSALNQRVLGSKMGTSVISRDIPMLIELYQNGDLKLDQLISNRFAFADINAALDDARAGNSIRNLLIFEDE